MIKAKTGDKVILKAFTGMVIGVFTVEKSSEKSIMLLKSDGEKMIFSRKTGIQKRLPEERKQWASRIIDDDGSFVPYVRAPHGEGKRHKRRLPQIPLVDVEEVIAEDGYIDPFFEEEQAKKQKKKTSVMEEM